MLLCTKIIKPHGWPGTRCALTVCTEFKIDDKFKSWNVSDWNAQLTPHDKDFHTVQNNENVKSKWALILFLSDTAAGKSLPSITGKRERGQSNLWKSKSLLSSFFLFEVTYASKAPVASCGRFTNIKYASVDLTLTIMMIWKSSSGLWLGIQALRSSYFSLKNILSAHHFGWRL